MGQDGTQVREVGFAKTGMNAVFIYICIYYTYIDIYIYVYIYIQMYISIYIHLYFKAGPS